MSYFSDNEGAEHIYSVTEITQEIKDLLESTFPPVWIQGEISNFNHHSSGHMYFTLKDENCQIAAVMWRSRNAVLPFYPQDGMKVNALGSIRVYEKRGNYQLDVMKLVPAGVGELQLAFEQLKQKLQQEGLFAMENKKPLPALPRRIGVVTSKTGAAIHDLLNVLGRRFPLAEVILRPTLVQGQGAAEDIASAIDEFNRFGAVDVLIVGRGGGSLEDLWPFNEEIVARAIYRSSIPVVSAVGHEVDFTIADFVADVRAATPSAAAEIVVPDVSDLRYQLEVLKQKAADNLLNQLRAKKDKFQSLLNSYGLRRPLDRIAQFRQRIDDMWNDCFKSLRRRIENRKNRLEHLIQMIDNFHPHAILRRGYTITRKQESGAIVTDAGQLVEGDEISTQFASGSTSSRVLQINQN